MRGGPRNKKSGVRGRTPRVCGTAYTRTVMSPVTHRCCTLPSLALFTGFDAALPDVRSLCSTRLARLSCPRARPRLPSAARPHPGPPALVRRSARAQSRMADVFCTDPPCALRRAPARSEFGVRALFWQGGSAVDELCRSNASRSSLVYLYKLSYDVQTPELTRRPSSTSLPLRSRATPRTRIHDAPPRTLGNRRMSSPWTRPRDRESATSVLRAPSLPRSSGLRCPSSPRSVARTHGSCTNFALLDSCDALRRSSEFPACSCAKCTHTDRFRAALPSISPTATLYRSIPTLFTTEGCGPGPSLRACEGPRRAATNSLPSRPRCTRLARTHLPSVKLDARTSDVLWTPIGPGTVYLLLC